MLGLTPMTRALAQRRNNDMLDFFDVMDDFFNAPMLRTQSGIEAFKLDVEEDEGNYFISAELPGVTKEEISLDYADNRFVIAIERKEEIVDEKKQYLHRERRQCAMKRSIYLKDIQVEGIQAKLEDGVLKVRVPKLDKEQNKFQITIE